MVAEHLKKFVITEGDSIRQAMQAINDNWREVVLVLDAQARVIGLVTDGDIRRGLLEGHTMDSPASAIMSRQFRRVGPQAGRVQVLDFMRALGIRQVPVLDEAGRLLSIHFMSDLIGSEPKPNLAVVMAGGRGTRLRPYTEHCPKPMVLVAGRPILEHIVLHLVGHGLRDILISVHYLAEMIERHFGDGSRFGCRIRYLREDKPLGTGGSLTLLPEPPAEPLVVMNGDQMTQADLTQMLAFHKGHGLEVTIGVRPHAVEIPFGVVRTEGHRLLDIVEKPMNTCMVSTGIYVLSPSALELIPPGEDFPITNLFSEMLRLGRPIGCSPIVEPWLDVGNPGDLLKANGLG